MIEGPSRVRASASMTSTSGADDGANTVTPGMERANTMSSTPWWLGPSSPVIPARSRTMTTGSRWSPTSRLAWSKARLKNVEYTATTGRNPAMAMPAAAVTACCSAIPTSMKRSGKRAWKGSRPVGPGMAAVMATIRGSDSAWWSSDRVKASVKVVTGSFVPSTVANGSFRAADPDADPVPVPVLCCVRRWGRCRGPRGPPQLP